MKSADARNEIVDTNSHVHWGETSFHNPTCLSRRQFITSVAALGATEPFSLNQAFAQSGTPVAAGGSSPRIIDVHHHLLPPKYIAAKRADILKVSAMSSVLDWTVARSLDDMDKSGVRTAIVSVSTPGIWFGKADEGRGLAREINEFAARMAIDPGPFRFLRRGAIARHRRQPKGNRIRSGYAPRGRRWRANELRRQVSWRSRIYCCV